MGTRSTGDLPARLAQLQRRFEHWRQGQQGRSRIPESLWHSAVRAAGRYGLHRTARALRLDYAVLKKRLAAAGAEGLPDHPSISADRPEAATFVELRPPASNHAHECILELEDSGGAKMRVHLKGVEAPDLVALSRSFWGTDIAEQGTDQSLRKPTGRRRR